MNEWEEKTSRADHRYSPANAAKPMVEVMKDQTRTATDRELMGKIVERLIVENEQ